MGSTLLAWCHLFICATVKTYHWFDMPWQICYHYQLLKKDESAWLSYCIILFIGQKCISRASYRESVDTKSEQITRANHNLQCASTANGNTLHSIMGVGQQMVHTDKAFPPSYRSGRLLWKIPSYPM